MKQTLFILALFFAVLCNGQSSNLIPNSSFENIKWTPTKFAASAMDFDTSIVAWFSGNNASPNIITSKISDQSQSYKMPAPKTGKSMVGLINNLGIWTEYINVKLNEPIQKGKTYYGEFWFMVLESSNPSNIEIQESRFNSGFGIWFNHGEKSPKKNFILETPQIASQQTEICPTYTWEKISGTFVADDDYTHLCLGQFKTDFNTQINGFIVVDDVVVRETEPLKLEAGATLVFENIIFKSGTAILEKESFPILESLVQGMKYSKDISLVINGHTDDVGNDIDNQILSENRAQTIYEYLIQRGIKKDYLQYKGFGETQPVADNTNSNGRKKNRRVEFQVLSKNEVHN